MLAEPEELGAAAERLVQAIASNAPLTLQAAKLAIRAHTVDPALMRAADDLASRADGSADYVEGRAAFAAKRPPRFTGV